MPADLATSDGLVRHPIQQSGFGEIADLGNFGGVDEELHGVLNIEKDRPGLAGSRPIPVTRA